MNIIIINCFDTYEHRVDLLYEVFSNEGHKVKVFTSDFRHFEKVKRNDLKKDFQFFKAEPYIKNLSYKRLHSHTKLSKDIFTHLNTGIQNVDLLWILVPPNSFVKDAARYKMCHQNVKLIFDLIDLWPETMPVGAIKKCFPFTVWKNIRDKNIQTADYVVTECSLYQEKLKKILQGMRTSTLYLARPLVPYVPHLNLPKDRINICYLGSINNIIDIDIIANIIKEFKKQKSVELHIVGDGERKDELIDAAEKSGASVIFHGKVYNRIEKQNIFDSCHYGLNIMKTSVCVGLTMKSMDYMEFGLPIINNIMGDTWDVINEYKIGFNINELFAFNSFEYDYDSRVRVRKCYERHFTIDNFSKTVLDIVKNV